MRAVVECVRLAKLLVARCLLQKLLHAAADPFLARPKHALSSGPCSQSMLSACSGSAVPVLNI